MLADAVKLGSSSIIDGINSVSQASDAIQIVTEQEFESPVDTALIQVVAPSSGSVANITFSPSALQISVGGTGTITATAYDSSNNAISDASLNWSIGNPAIATLSASGNTVQVKGTSAGTTELTATAGSGFTAFVPVTVSATSSGPTVGGVSPNPVPPTNSNQTLTINGSNFQSGATLTYYDTNGKASPGHTAAFVSSSQLVDSAFDDASDVGVWKVVVVNPNSTSSAAFAFNVSASTSAPTVSSVSPNPVPPSNTAQTLTINGSNFQSGATLTYYDTSGNIYAGRTATFVSSSQLIDPAFDDANDSGTWKVVVVNPGGTSSAASSFTVAASSSNPSLSGLSTSPNPPVAGQQFTLTLNGSNFDPSTVQILISGPGCSSCAVANAVLTTKTATQVISAVTLNSPGSYTVTVENGASGTPSNSLPLTVGGGNPISERFEHEPESACSRPAVHAHSERQQLQSQFRASLDWRRNVWRLHYLQWDADNQDLHSNCCSSYVKLVGQLQHHCAERRWWWPIQCSYSRPRITDTISHGTRHIANVASGRPAVHNRYQRHQLRSIDRANPF